jgi:hypothetical protein
MKANARPFNLIQFSALILFVCGLLVCAGGCTTPGSSIEVKQTPAQDLSKYKSIAVEVTNKDPDFDANEVDHLTDSILDGLRKSARFDKVYANSSPNEHNTDLKLSVAVQFVVAANMNKVQSIETSVAFIDTGDGKTLASASVNSHTEWALFGGHMTNAIVKLSDQIVDFATKY